jgi:hypothetical protein
MMQPHKLATNKMSSQVIDLGNFKPGDTWSVTQAHLLDIRNDLIKETQNFIQSHKTQWPNDIKILEVSYIQILLEIMTITRCALAVQDYKAQNINLQIPDKGYPYTQALYENTSLLPAIYDRLSFMRRAVTGPPKYLRPLRYIKNALDQSVYKRKTARQIKPTDIVSFATSTFMERHAARLKQETRQDIVFCSFWEWFNVKNKTLPAFKDITRDLSDTEAAYLKRLQGVLEKHGLILGDHIKDAQERFIIITNSYVKFYWGHLTAAQRIHTMPKTLWFGSSNSLFPRLFRAVVKDLGGHTVGHDHGRGIILSYNVGEMGTVFDFCDEFVTYSSYLAERGNADKQNICSYTVTGVPITFSEVNDCLIQRRDIKAFQEKQATFQVNPNRTRKIAMFIDTFFIGERITGLNLFPSNTTIFDFRARVFEALIDQDYEVILKLHPENTIDYPPALLDHPRIKIMDGYVEDQLADCDVIIFDFLSSFFKTLIMSNKPMVFLDFGYSQFDDAIDAVLDKRIGHMKGWFDDENRAQISWNQLGEVLNNALEKTGDQTALKTLYGVETLSCA